MKTSFLLKKITMNAYAVKANNLHKLGNRFTFISLKPMNHVKLNAGNSKKTLQLKCKRILFLITIRNSLITHRWKGQSSWIMWQRGSLKNQISPRMMQDQCLILYRLMVSWIILNIDSQMYSKKYFEQQKLLQSLYIKAILTSRSVIAHSRTICLTLQMRISRLKLRTQIFTTTSQRPISWNHMHLS